MDLDGVFQLLMIRRVRYFSSIFLERELRRGIRPLIFAFFVAILEILGIASMMPFFAIISNPNSVFTNRILSTLYKELNFSSVQQFILFLGFAVIGIILFSNSIKTYAAFLNNKFLSFLRQSLQSRLLKSYVNQPYKFFLNSNTSELNKVIWSDIEFVISYVVTPLMLIFANASLLLLILVLISVIQFTVAISIIAFVSFFGLLFGWYLKTRDKNSAFERGEAAKKSYIVLNEVLGGIKDVKVFQKERSFTDKFDINNKEYARLWAKSTTISQVPKFVLETVAFSLLISIMLVMLFTLKDMAVIIPLLGVYAFSAYKVVPAIQIIFQGVSSIKQGWPSVRLLHSNLAIGNRSPEIVEAATESIVFNHSIELSKIHYRYPDAEKDVLDDLNVIISCNSTVGIVGGTGAGKTTLVDMLLGLHEPDKGSILVDSISLDQHNMYAWKNIIGYVPQQIFLTDASIIENIAFGLSADDINMEAIIEASKLASFHDFVINELPEGYNTIVGERGVRLSGGQKQRLGIARALFRKPQLLILDEATSALDNVTESYIINALEKIKGTCTVLIIAHRFSTIQKCDNIIVLKKGRIIEEGLFEDLMSTSNEFKKLSLIK